MWISFFVGFTACNNKVNNGFEKSIIGEWKLLKEEVKIEVSDEMVAPPPIEFMFTGGGFDFQTNNICENKLGYFKRIDHKTSSKGRYIYLGTITKYKIDKDTLRIYNLNDSTWETQKIINIKMDTLILKEKNGHISKYAKARYNIDSIEKYDQIIISASGCYGPCPVDDISISKNGEVIYFGYYYTTKKGYYKSKVNNELFSKLENDFKKASIKNLQDNYSVNHTDDEEITVSFIKDNKIVKTISDYGRKSPVEFKWAYSWGRYLYQQINFDSISVPLKYTSFPNISIETNEKIYVPSQSEGFYLWTLLINSKETTKKFTGKYMIINDNKIKTDGQFFSLTNKDGTSKTYDVGFNFIIRNELDKKLKPKRKEE